MSVALAFRSSKLCFRSNKLGVRTQYYPCDVSFQETAYGYSSSYYNTTYCLTGYPYTTAMWSNANNAAVNNPTWVTAYCSAQIRTDHSHGDGSSASNECMMQSGYRTFLVPASFPGSVTAAFLRIYNCGAVRHTIIYGPPGTLVNAYAGRMAILGDDNFSLLLSFYASDTVYYDVSVPLSQIRSLNAANGVIVANMGRYTYKMNGYIDVPLPSQVLSIINAYSGVYLCMLWSWGSVQAGGYCPYCLGDYTYNGYQSSLNACAVICTDNMLALNPDLYVS